MALWNAPLITEYHALYACEAALSCQRKLREKNEVWNRLGLPEFRARIGINTGEVLIGNVGSFQRFNYTAIGDNVNISARLEGLGKRYGVDIILGEGSYRKVCHKFLCRLLDKVAVKGKLVPLSIYELVVEIDTATQEQKDFCQSYTDAFNLLLQNDIGSSYRAFEILSAKYPEDKATRMLFLRLEKLFRNQGNEQVKWPGFQTYYEK